PPLLALVPYTTLFRSLDHVRIGGGEHHARLETTRAERFIELAAPGKAEYVGNDRVARQRFQRQRFLTRERMTVGHHHGTVPAVRSEEHTSELQSRENL